jgi:Spy/CpxP family protein refolding chaperone
MKKYFAIIALVVLAAFSLSAFAQDKTAPLPDKKENPGARGPLARIKEDLQLTPDQEAKLKEFQKVRQAEGQAFAEQMKKVRTDLQTLRKDDKADPSKVNGLIDQMFKLQADRAKAQFKNRKDMEKIFTPDQLQKMKNGREQFLGGDRMGGFMPGRMGMRMGMGARMGMGMGTRMGMGMGMGRGMMNRGSMMRGPLMRFGMRMGRMMQRFMPRGGRPGFGPMGRPGMGMMRQRPGSEAPIKEKAPEKKAPETKK